MCDFNVWIWFWWMNLVFVVYVLLWCNMFVNVCDMGELYKIGDCFDLLLGYFGVLYVFSWFSC